MQGTLYKVEDKWIVRYEDIKTLFPFTEYEIIDLPLNPIHNIPYYDTFDFTEGLPVFFKIIDDTAMLISIGEKPLLQQLNLKPKDI